MTTAPTGIYTDKNTATIPMTTQSAIPYVNLNKSIFSSHFLNIANI